MKKYISLIIIIILFTALQINRAYAHEKEGGETHMDNFTIKQIREITPQNGSKTVAFVDVDFGGIEIRSLRLAKFDNGYVLQPASRQATQKEKDKGFKSDYVNVFKFTDEALQKELCQAAVASIESK